MSFLKKWNKNFFRHIKCERIHHQKPALQEMLKEILQGERKWYQCKAVSTQRNEEHCKWRFFFFIILTSLDDHSL